MIRIAMCGESLLVKISGRGHPVLLLHGGSGLDHTTWLLPKPQADWFKLKFLDHRSNGRAEGAALSRTSCGSLIAEAEALREAPGVNHPTRAGIHLAIKWLWNMGCVIRPA